MKKILFFLIAVVFVATSCEGPMGPEGPAGPSGSLNRYVYDYEVRSVDWSAAVDNNDLFLHYQCFFNETDLTSNIYNNGVLVAYLEVKEGDNYVQKPLPYEIVIEDSNGMYTQTIDFDYSTGSIGFYVKNSKFIEDKPGTMLFRVVFLW